MIPRWQTDHLRGAGVVEPMTIAGLRPAGGMLGGEERVSVPLLLRVCVQCGAAQAFADPAAVHMLTQLQPPVAFYVDATNDAGGYR
jgi:hypothetical protein